MMRAAIIDKVEAVVLICPITPIDCPKVDAMSTRRSPEVMAGGANANLAVANAGRRNLPLAFFSGLFVLSTLFTLSVN
jgi:hypothetical protein